MSPAREMQQSRQRSRWSRNATHASAVPGNDMKRARTLRRSRAPTDSGRVRNQLKHRRDLVLKLPNKLEVWVDAGQQERDDGKEVLCRRGGEDLTGNGTIIPVLAQVDNELTDRLGHVRLVANWARVLDLATSSRHHARSPVGWDCTSGGWRGRHISHARAPPAQTMGGGRRVWTARSRPRLIDGLPLALA
eukprot:scaffold154691_cov31-Tisochrysis_lutea.AAC.3